MERITRPAPDILQQRALQLTKFIEYSTRKIEHLIALIEHLENETVIVQVYFIEIDTWKALWEGYPFLRGHNRAIYEEMRKALIDDLDSEKSLLQRFCAELEDINRQLRASGTDERLEV